MTRYIFQNDTATGPSSIGIYYTDRSPDYFSGLNFDDNINVGIATVGLATIGIATIGIATIGIASIGIATIGIFTSRVHYQTTIGKIIGPGNHLNTQSSSSIIIDTSQSCVSIGTIGSIPVWNFTNVPENLAEMSTVTVVGICSQGTTLSMGSDYTVNGGSTKKLTWSTTSTPVFNSSNWSILTFRILTDGVGLTSVFATKLH